jgi:sulfur carrier protein
MKVVLRNPRREVELAGGRRVKDILKELDIIPETVLVIRGDELVTADQVVNDADTIELRPVMSGGSSSRTSDGSSAGRGASIERAAARRASGARGLAP